MRIALIPILALALAGCQEKSESAKIKEAAIKEVEIREAEIKEKVAQRQSEERRARLRTLRVLSFVILSGGAVFALVWLSRPIPYVDRSLGSTVRPPVTNWRDARPTPSHRRIIDISAQPSEPKPRQPRKRK